MSNNGNYKDLGINSPKELFNLETEVYKQNPDGSIFFPPGSCSDHQIKSCSF